MLQWEILKQTLTSIQRLAVFLKTFHQFIISLQTDEGYLWTHRQFPCQIDVTDTGLFRTFPIWWADNYCHWLIILGRPVVISTTCVSALFKWVGLFGAEIHSLNFFVGTNGGQFSCPGSKEIPKTTGFRLVIFHCISMSNLQMSRTLWFEGTHLGDFPRAKHASPYGH